MEKLILDDLELLRFEKGFNVAEVSSTQSVTFRSFHRERLIVNIKIDITSSEPIYKELQDKTKRFKITIEEIV